MDAVAVGADRGLRVAPGDRLAVDALVVLLLDCIVAPGAGGGHIEFEDRRFIVARLANFVDAMAVGADRGFGRSGGYSFAVDAFLVRVERLRALADALHDEFLAVAGAAGGGNVGVADGGFRIAGCEDLVRAAVAGQACRGLLLAVLASGSVDTRLIAVDRVVVASRTLLGNDFVRSLDLVGFAVAAGAGIGAENGVNAFGDLAGGLVVASGAGGQTHPFGMGIFFYAFMA